MTSTTQSMLYKDVFLTAGEFLGVLFAGVLFGVWSGMKRKEWNILKMWKSSKRIMEDHSRVHEALTELRVTVRACRCLVFQFHNGGSFADGTSIKRFSVTHESCALSVSSMILESQDVLLTRYMELVRVMDDSSGKIIKTDSLPMGAFRSGLEINNVEYFSIVPLRCLDGLSPLGFLCCHWCSNEPLDDIEKEGITEDGLEQVILESAETINTYLTHKYKKH